ncbi:MAG TPA: TlpA disulfide reductase family protein [Edaphobacter sp.]|jgi:thiol-disulfide isomerase/thioredoxin|nr:TlpA disulfide reductase family protein [Edaphobacter sp.]
MPKLSRLCATLLLCLLVSASQAKRVPNLELKDLSGNKQKLASLQGSIAVISFWATWCTPCRDELPRLSKLAEAYKPSGVRFLAISIDEPKDRAKVAPYIAQQKLTMDVWVGGDTDMLDRVGLGNIVPGTLIIDQQGEVVGRIMGEAREEDVKSRVDWLLNGRQGAPPEALTKRY